MNDDPLRVLRRSLASLGVPALLALALSGCPRTPAAVDPPDGVPCEQTADCNPDGVFCGALKLCVDGFCEEGTSLLNPCPDVGEPVRPPEP